MFYLQKVEDEEVIRYMNSRGEKDSEGFEKNFGRIFNEDFYNAIRQSIQDYLLQLSYGSC